MFDVIDALRGGVDGLADCGYANTPPISKGHLPIPTNRLYLSSCG